MNYQRWGRGESLQHLDLYLQRPESRAGKQNARHRPLLTSCLFPVEPTPLQTTIHDDAHLVGANFHSGQYGKVGKPVSIPSPSHPFLQPVPGTSAGPVKCLSSVRRSPFLQKSTVLYLSPVCCFSPPPRPILARTLQKALHFRT